MQRSKFPIIVIGVIVAVGFWVRFNRLQRESAKPEPAPAPTATVQPFSLPAPPDDCVAKPLIDPAEATQGPARIISMAPSITELCVAMGLADRLVGRTQFCRYPPAVQNVEVIGGYVDPNLERIVTIKPDLILITTSSGQLREKLASLDLPVQELPDSSVEDIFAAIEKLGRLVGRPATANHLAERIEDDLVRLAGACQGVQPQRVLILLGELPETPRSVYVAGPGSYLDQIVHDAGHTNALQGHMDRPWGEISAETILVAKPDAILEARTTADPTVMANTRRAWSEFKQVPAFANWRLCTIDDDSILVPGPRVNVTLYRVIKALAPVE